MSSVADNVSKRQEELVEEVERVQKSMSRSPSGRRMVYASQQMAASSEMIELMALIGDPSVTEAERTLLAQYMGEMLKADPENGLVNFSKYLDGVAADPVYAVRKDYYLAVSQASLNLHGTEIYQDYIAAYQDFESDNSPQARAARKATEDMQEKMRSWASGNSENN